MHPCVDSPASSRAGILPTWVQGGTPAPAPAPQPAVFGPLPESEAAEPLQQQHKGGEEEEEQHQQGQEEHAPEAAGIMRREQQQRVLSALEREFQSGVVRRLGGGRGGLGL